MTTAAVTTKSMPQSRLETNLLRLCARVDVTQSLIERIEEAIDRQPDWTVLLELARAHKTLPLLHNALRQVDHAKVPEAVTQELAFCYLSNAASNHRLAKELVDVAGSLSQADIPILPFKGPALALSAYRDLNLRHYGDLDILVRTKDVPAASEILLRHGFAVPDHLNVDGKPGFLSDSSFMESAESLRQYQFFRNDSTTIELHWELGPRYFAFPLGNKDLWSRAVPARFMSADVYTWPPEMMFLVLVNHATKHGWRRLSWICDIVELIRRIPSFDWPHVISSARAMHMLVMVKVAVRLAADMLDCPLPQDAGQLLAPDRRVDELCGKVDRYHREVLQCSESSHWHEHHFGMHSPDRMKDRLAYRLFLLTTPTAEEWDMISLPRQLSALYRGIRIYRLAMLWRKGKRIAT